MNWRRAEPPLLVPPLIGGHRLGRQGQRSVKAVTTTTVCADLVAAVGGLHVKG